MADVGDIDHVVDLVAAVFEGAAQHIFEDIGAVIADVLKVVDGGATGVEPDFGGLQGFEGALLARVGVEEMQGHRSIGMRVL